MILSTYDYKRSFEIYPQNLNFVTGLLSSNISSPDPMILVGTNEYISNINAKLISRSITNLTKNHKIYEVWDGCQAHALVDPSIEVMHSHGSTIQPLTEKRLKFLNQLSKFLNSKNNYRIIKEREEVYDFRNNTN